MSNQDYIDLLNADIAKDVAAITDKQSQLVGIRATIVVYEDTIDSLNDQIPAVEKQISDLETEITYYNQIIALIPPDISKK